MDDTKSTNCIVVIKKGGIRLKDGVWLDDIEEMGTNVNEMFTI